MGCCNDREMRLKNTQDNYSHRKQENKGEGGSEEPQFKSEPNIALKPIVEDEECRSERKEDLLALHEEDTAESKLLDEILENYHQCKYFYQEHDIDQAHYYSDKFMKQFEQYKNSKKASSVVLDSKQAYFKLINQVNEEYADVVMISEEIKKGGWVEKSNKKGVRISTRREDTTVGTLVQAELDQPFEILISILIEMDLYKHFMPFMKVSRQEKIVARNCRIGYTENHIPILSVREAFFQGIGYNRLNYDNTVFLCTRSIHNRPDLQQKLGYECKINPKYIQLEYKYFILIYEPIRRGKGKITLAMNVDTKMDFIPIWLQDKISQDFGNQFYASVLKQTKGFKGSLWQKNVQQNPALFNFFQTEINKHLNYLENPELKKKQKSSHLKKCFRPEPISEQSKMKTEEKTGADDSKSPERPERRRSKIFKDKKNNN